ncbi:lipase family protein [Streptomyces sp. DSM 44917]|uniref:Lipase family protein n=1 Tax=Streptomyces boetiae TaxID=3075541 RepID=A0ABU2L4J0_9ACTN|nr:lipase family protein [Streptomyces sp. DSM 44917]MDT0306450.1 lipase family protein [Streptomyces sp. DSM 44917]
MTTAPTPTPARGGGRTRGSARRRLACALAVVASVGAGVAFLPAPASGAPERPAAQADAPGVPAFYDPPATLPAADGALVRTEPLTLGLRLPGLNGRALPGTATRLMYKSTDSRGRPMAVTGAYIEPAADWDGPGPRPLVALAPGTMGQGDQCAASLALENPFDLDILGGTVSVGYENIAVYRLLAEGIAVVVTDYAGLGTPDRVHTYVNRVDEGHAVLDAVRAARAVEGASVTAASPVGLYGYSQGGGATAAAAELQPSYAPELALAGVYSGAPPADLAAVLEGVDGSALASAIGWTVNGAAESDPALLPLIEENLNDAGREALAESAEMCVGDGMLAHGFTESTEWTATGETVGGLVAREPAARAFLAAQRLGRARPAVPVRVATGVADDTVPHAQARRLAVDWCARGADVTYVPVRLPNLGDGLVLTNHFLPLIADQGDALAWLTDRLEGEPAAPNCAALPRLP